MIENCINLLSRLKKHGGRKVRVSLAGEELSEGRTIWVIVHDKETDIVHLVVK